MHSYMSYSDKTAVVKNDQKHGKVTVMKFIF